MARIKRKIATVGNLFHRGGVSALWAGARQRLVELPRRRPGELVQIDGCKFSLRGLPEDVRHLLLAGDYEGAERAAIRRYLDSSAAVIELGASIGVIACLANRRLKDRGRHVVVEANPSLVPAIEANRARNRGGFQIRNEALAYGKDSIAFPIADNSLTSSVLVGGTRTAVVRAVTLDQIRRDSAFDRFTLICDIEGSEADLIRNEAVCLADHAGMIIIEMHPKILGAQEADDLVRALVRLNFEIRKNDGDVYVFQNRRLVG